MVLDRTRLLFIGGGMHWTEYCITQQKLIFFTYDDFYKSFRMGLFTTSIWLHDDMNFLGLESRYIPLD